MKNMIGASFNQKKILKQKKFTITERGVECYEKEGLEEITYTVPFPEIIESPVKKTKYSKLWLIIWILCSVLFFMDFIENYLMEGEFNKSFLFWTGIVMVFSCFQFFATYKNLVFYSLNNLPLCFLKDVPNANAITEFMDKVFEAQERYFEEKYDKQISAYGSADSNISYADELYKLNKLRENGIIDDIEYETVKQKLLGSIEKEKRKHSLQ